MATTDTKAQLNQDLKTAMLAGQAQTVTTLRGLKGAILNVEIQKSARESGLPEAEVISILTKEAKKRQEAADMYLQAGDQSRADIELAEQKLIQKYLPAQMTDDELSHIIDSAIAKLGAKDASQMGQVIGAVKQQAGPTADGARIAAQVKQKLT